MISSSNCRLVQYKTNRFLVMRTIGFIGILLMLLILICAPQANAYQLENCKWPQPTSAFYVDIPGADGLWNRAFETAMYLWGVGTLFQYKIARGVYEDPCNPQEGKNGVAFGSTFCGDEWGATTLATTHIRYREGIILETDIIFNSNLPWSVYSSSWRSDVKDFQRVSVHELGHALGLDHEESGVATIMRSHAGDITIPQQDDINGVAAIYGGPAPPPTPPPTPPPSSSGGGGGGCFIATAAYGTYLHPHVEILRSFRDKHLMTNSLGRSFIGFYYEHSPPIADFISQHENLKTATRIVLTPIVYVLKYPLTVGFILIIGIVIRWMIRRNPASDRSLGNHRQASGADTG